MTKEMELRDQLDKVSIEEEELFQKRQRLIHQAIEEENQEGLHDSYLEIRQYESRLRYEHLHLENLLHPGHSYQDHGGNIGELDSRRKYVYLILMVVSAVALLLLMTRS